MNILIPNDTQFKKYYETHCKYLRLNGLQPATIDAYSRAMRRIGKYFKYQVDNLSTEQLLNYFDDLIQTHSSSTVKLDLWGLKFFYKNVLRKPWTDIPKIKQPKSTYLRDIVTIKQVAQILNATRIINYRVFFFTIYSLGLRIKEGLTLKVGDIDADRMRVHIRNSKGNKDRFVPLPKKTLEVLRDFWKMHKHPSFIFPNRLLGLKKSRNAKSHMNVGGAQEALKKVITEIGIRKRITPHSLRHSYATHLLEAGVGIIELQKILGHYSILTTAVYTHLTAKGTQCSTRKINKLMSAFDIALDGDK